MATSVANTAARSSRSVFVGNIPYDATEEQLIEIFQEVGPVVSFRLVFDRETGKPKGYGFCEYRDSATALSAMRNLNAFEMNGRPLRVDFAENEKGMMEKEDLIQMRTYAPGQPPIVSTLSNPTGVTGEVAKILEGMSTSQLYEIMIQMKSLIQKNSEHLRHLIINNPQFAYALLQSQVILEMITPEVAKQMLNAPTALSSIPPPGAIGSPTMGGPPLIPGRPVPPPPGNMSVGPMGPIGPPHLAPGPGGPMGPFGYQGGQGPFQPSMPPMPIHHNGPAYPAMMQQHVANLSQSLNQPTTVDQLGEILQEDQKQLLEQVMNLTPEQIEKLQPQERQQIMQLRQTMMSLNYVPH